MVVPAAKITTCPFGRIITQITLKVTGKNDRHSNTYAWGCPDSASQTHLLRLSWVYQVFIPVFLILPVLRVEQCYSGAVRAPLSMLYLAF